jgi:indole-3-glycerol phosphate synthase
MLGSTYARAAAGHEDPQVIAAVVAAATASHGARHLGRADAAAAHAVAEAPSDAMSVLADRAVSTVTGCVPS